MKSSLKKSLGFRQMLAAGAAVLSMTVAALVPAPAYAQFGGIVYDPSNYSQNILTAARTLEGPDLRWPVVQMQNVFILPGIPEIFRRKFLAIRERFREAPFLLRRVYVRCDEGPIADPLEAVANRFPEVAIGSYPRMQPAEDGNRVLLTLEGKHEPSVQAAVEELLRQIAEHVIHST